MRQTQTGAVNMPLSEGLLEDEVNVVAVRQSMSKIQEIYWMDLQMLISLLFEEERRIDLEKWFQLKMDAIQEFLSWDTVVEK